MKKNSKAQLFLGKKPTPEMLTLLRSVAHDNRQIGVAALQEVARALTLPLQQGVLNGDIFSYIFEPIYFEPGVSVEFPYDFISPGTERNFKAFVVPRTGALPERAVEGEFVTVPVYELAATLDWSMKYMRDARWDIVGRALQVLESMFIRKMNTDAWRVILTAGKNRNLLATDDAATAGNFSKRLLTVGEVLMRRNGGGNSSSVNRPKLTDLHISPESRGDMSNWNLTEIPDAVRTTIFLNGPLAKIGTINIRDLDELGVGQEFDNYYTTNLGGSLSGKNELGIGLDLQDSNDSAFVMPYRSLPEPYEDLWFARQRRVGIGATAEVGFSSLDNRRVVLFGI
jgi:hypothetical protein